jgi:tRNA (guanine-N7-)-methyltransferase
MTVEVPSKRLDWDLSIRATEKFDNYWLQKKKNLLPENIFRKRRLWLEIGAGTGAFFLELARLHPETEFIAIERCRMRAKRLVKRTARSGLPNLHAIRGNAISALIGDVPAESIAKIFILYPCPWPKTSQRLNRWYLHPIMPHLDRVLKPDGILVWSSDQEFYVNEAQYVCQKSYGMETLSHGRISPNAYNHIADFPGGRTKFESAFQSAGTTCYELIVRKVSRQVRL